LPLASIAVEELRRLPSYGWDEYVFPADRTNVRFRGKSVHRWDMRDSFKAACERAGKEFENLRIHDLRHMATTILFLRGIPEAVIRKLTGHRSRELERYEHLSPLIKQQTVELIASELKSAADTATDAGDTATDAGDTAADAGDTATDAGDKAADAGDTATDTLPSEGLKQDVEVIEKFGGDDGARTRDLRRDRGKK
jgi:hypothetical protein